MHTKYKETSEGGLAIGVNMSDFNKNMDNLVSNMEEKTKKEESDVNSLD